MEFERKGRKQSKRLDQFIDRSYIVFVRILKRILPVKFVDGTIYPLWLKIKFILGLKKNKSNRDFDRTDYLHWIARYDTLSEDQINKMRTWSLELPAKPIISVIMPVYNGDPLWLRQAIESVITQVYPYWELCIADDASDDPLVRKTLTEFCKIDPRIKVVYRKQNGHISASSNSALEIANGSWVALLDHDDLLPIHALYWVAVAITNYPKARLIYSDEDKIDNGGVRSQPYFKCDWNRELFYSQNMISHLGVYDLEVVRQVGGFRVGLEGSQDYDLALRVIENINNDEIIHIPKILYHWRIHMNSTSLSGGAKPYAMSAGVKALNDHFDRCGIIARAELNQWSWYRVRYGTPHPDPLVSIVILTKDRLQLLKPCIESILKKTTYRNYEIIIIDNESEDAETLEYLQSLNMDARIRCIRDESPFNFSLLNNKAVQHANGEYLILLNNDMEVITHTWIEEMLGIASLPGTGAVGAMLYYPDDTIQHAGVILGMGGVAGHAFKNVARGHPGYFGRAGLVQEYSAVTAACLMVKKDIYEQVGGLDEKNLTIAFNDVDFCLKIKKCGFRNIWTPYAELYHHESASRGIEDTPEKMQRFSMEVEFMKNKWTGIISYDPAYSPNLTLEFEDFSLAWPPGANLISTDIYQPD